MYNLLIALAVAVAVWLLVMIGFPWYAGILPALLVLPVVLFLLTRRTSAAVQQDLLPVQAMMQELGEARDPKLVQQRLAQVRDHMAAVRDRYGKWQVLLARQLDAQIGMLDYMQQRFDEALPRLQGAWRDGTVTAAVACIHHRRGRHAEAWAAFEQAARYAPKDPTIYVLWATLREKRGDREEALKVLAAGLEAVPGHALLRQLKDAVANKRPIDVNAFAETWYRFFPEQVTQQALVRGRRGPHPVLDQVQAQVRLGPPQPKPRGKLARRR